MGGTRTVDDEVPTTGQVIVRDRNPSLGTAPYTAVSALRRLTRPARQAISFAYTRKSPSEASPVHGYNDATSSETLRDSASRHSRQRDCAAHDSRIH
ncbi:hypothetical protein MRX96_028380 [Rhipicephalus microplus]